MKKWIWILMAVLLLVGALFLVRHPRQTKHVLKMLPTEQRLSLRSLNGNTSSTITFSNYTELALQLLWLDYHGRPQKYGEIAPHSSYTQATYATHAWLLMDDNSNAVALFQALPGHCVANIKN